ncbi:hypothetical protein EV208_11159 [Christensenella hongkongensis]|nr:hypothetical protein EV208_11159 [Christensenella hongkongensis]
MVFNNKLYEQKRQQEAARRRQKEEAERKRRQEEERRRQAKEEQQRQERFRRQQEAKHTQNHSVKATQSLLNGFGFTDNRGNPLKEDGVLGAKTKEATKKFGRYQEELAKPSLKTKRFQQELNQSGIRYLDGKPLREDGVYGPKTDHVNSKVDNEFTGWLMDDHYRPKTVSQKQYPTMPQLEDKVVKNIMAGRWSDLNGSKMEQPKQTGKRLLKLDLQSPVREAITSKKGESRNNLLKKDVSQQIVDPTQFQSKDELQEYLKQNPDAVLPKGLDGRMTGGWDHALAEKPSIKAAPTSPEDYPFELIDGEVSLYNTPQKTVIKIPEEKNRDTAMEKLGTLNGLTKDKIFSPLLKTIEDAESVSCETTTTTTTVDQINNRIKNEDKEMKEAGRNIRDTIMGVIGAASSIREGSIDPNQEFISDQFGRMIDGQFDQVDEQKPPKYSGYDKQGKKIGEITRETLDIKTGNDNWAAPIQGYRHQIIYEYYVQGNQKKILRIENNGKEIYNNYAEN